MSIDESTKQERVAGARFNEQQKVQKIQKILLGNMTIELGDGRQALVITLPTDSQDKAALQEFFDNGNVVKGSLEKAWGEVDTVAKAVGVMSQGGPHAEYLMLPDPEREGQTAFVLNQKLVEKMMQGNELPHDPDLAAALSIRVPSVAAAARR